MIDDTHIMDVVVDRTGNSDMLYLRERDVTIRWWRSHQNGATRRCLLGNPKCKIRIVIRKVIKFDLLTVRLLASPQLQYRTCSRVGKTECDFLNLFSRMFRIEKTILKKREYWILFYCICADTISILCFPACSVSKKRYWKCGNIVVDFYNFSPMRFT